MASSELIAKIRFLAEKNGYDIKSYAPSVIALREREALRSGKTRAEFARDILDEVSKQKQ